MGRVEIVTLRVVVRAKLGKGEGKGRKRYVNLKIVKLTLLL